MLSSDALQEQNTRLCKQKEHGKPREQDQHPTQTENPRERLIRVCVALFSMFGISRVTRKHPSLLVSVYSIFSVGGNLSGDPKDSACDMPGILSDN